MPALWKGLLYDEAALGAAESLISPLDAATLDAARPAIARRGLAAELVGKTLRDWAGQLLEIASGGLSRIADLDAQGRDESLFLRPLQARVESGQTAAELLLSALDGHDTPRAALVDHTRVA